MSSGIVRSAFRNAYTAQFPSVPYVDTVSKEVDNSALPNLWVTMQFQMSSEERRAIGSPSGWKEEGHCFVAVLGLSGLGDAAVVNHADAVRAYFRNWQSSGIMVRGVPMVLQEESSDGRWFMVVVDIIYERFFDG
jgi:hypothetical protein